ncbi:MAG: class I SAM-dependent methyltransferase [Cyclobacteriaceae bacterium]|nr:class I SAM-dependent methyltransferase [Cyclobacteriaceae bacterium]
MTITNPRPKEEEAGKYYQSTSYISHTSTAAGIMDYIYLIVRRFTLKWKYSLIKSHIQSGKLLDMGAGTGHFLNYCKSAGIEAYGVEPSQARTSANNNNIFQALNDLPEAKFRVITLWHVLEHVYDLKETLTQLKNKLEENGTILVAVPNLQSFDAKHYQDQWAAYDVPRHVWHFSKESMKALMENNGLHVKEIIPMKLDSYYVSLLSEKNISNGKLSLTGVVKGIWNGLRSNLKAGNEMNYSSLIYIIKK